eukprot:m.1248086 g.1248086  ORF g.1248086 m.1248086 type:complete len:308 (+) comp24697_c0_seq2:258-1181(+)
MSEFNLTELGGEEYESLPDSASPLIHALAGSIAGICEHTAMFPLDTVKTRLQKIKGNTNHAGTWRTLKNIYYNESPRTLFRGIGAVASGAGPAHAVYFSAYEHSKVMLGIADNPSAHPAATAGAGVVATLCHEATMNPVEVVKQRMQMQGSTFSGPLLCAKSTFKSEGLTAFYRSFPNQVFMSIPFQCTHLVCYEILRDKLNPEREYNPMVHLLSGAGAGAVAAAITNPFDVVKTLLNTQEKGIESSGMTNMFSAFRTIRAESGWFGFTKGMTARISLAAPGTAISWVVYEFFKEVCIPDSQKSDSY